MFPMTGRYSRWVFISICRRETFAVNHFEDRVHPRGHVRVCLDALSVHDYLIQILRIDATRKQLGGVVVEVLGLLHCTNIPLLWH